MFKNNAIKIATTLMIVMALSLSFTSQVVAQDPPVLIVVNQTQLKPGMMPRFNELHRDVIIPNQQANGVPWRLTQQVIFGDSFQVSTSIPLENYAQIDNFQPIASELADDFNESAVEWQRLFVVQARPELSIGGGQGVQQFRRLVRIQVKQDKILEFEEYWADTIMPAISQSGHTGYQLFQTVMGGPQGEYYGGLYFSNFAGLDGFNITGGLSADDAAELQADFGELIDEIEVSFVVITPGLTYGLGNNQ